MAARLNFPNSGLVANVTQYTGDNGTTYIWDGIKWVGRTAGGAVGTNSIQNGTYTVQVDNFGNLILPVGSVIRDANGTPIGGGTSGSSVTTGATPPVGPSLGDLWYDTESGRTYIYYDSSWIDASP